MEGKKAIAGRSSYVRKINNNPSGIAWSNQLEGHVTIDHGVVSSSLMLTAEMATNIEISKLRKKKKQPKC